MNKDEKLGAAKGAAAGAFVGIGLGVWIGAALGVVGLLLSFTGIGAILGVPIMIVGGLVGWCLPLVLASQSMNEHATEADKVKIRKIGEFSGNLPKWITLPLLALVAAGLAWLAWIVNG